MSNETKESSSESRVVHAANDALKAYLHSNKNINIIKDIPIQHIKRYDVWQCVFEKELEAFKELQIKEWYYMFLDYKSILSDTELTDKQLKSLKSIIATTAISLLVQAVEFKLPLKIKDSISIIVDCLGDDFLPILTSEAEHYFQRRKDIVKPYFKHDNEWVGYSITVLEAVKSFQ